MHMLGQMCQILNEHSNYEGPIYFSEVPLSKGINNNIDTMKGSNPLHNKCATNLEGPTETRRFFWWLSWEVLFTSFDLDGPMTFQTVRRPTKEELQAVLLTTRHCL